MNPKIGDRVQIVHTAINKYCLGNITYISNYGRLIHVRLDSFDYDLAYMAEHVEVIDGYDER